MRLLWCLALVGCMDLTTHPHAGWCKPSSITVYQSITKQRPDTIRLYTDTRFCRVAVTSAQVDSAWAGWH